MEKPLVGIVMGSDSDLSVMEGAVESLKEFGVPYELTIVSAHRTPDRLADYAKTAFDRGLKVIIAGAGGAAHLPGMLAAQTILPVIGVPVNASVGKALDGWDSILSILQMPKGVPVATVALDGAGNAGLLAVEIVALLDEEVSKKLDKYRNETMQEKVNVMITNTKTKHPNQFDN
jgi:5-(carboxyamino)imidazole ribonucleotide mutase